MLWNSTINVVLDGLSNYTKYAYADESAYADMICILVDRTTVDTRQWMTELIRKTRTIPNWETHNTVRYHDLSFGCDRRWMSGDIRQVGIWVCLFVCVCVCVCVFGFECSYSSHPNGSQKHQKEKYIFDHGYLYDSNTKTHTTWRVWMSVHAPMQCYMKAKLTGGKHYSKTHKLRLRTWACSSRRDLFLPQRRRKQVRMTMVTGQHQTYQKAVS